MSSEGEMVRRVSAEDAARIFEAREEPKRKRREKIINGVTAVALLPSLWFFFAVLVGGFLSGGGDTPEEIIGAKIGALISAIYAPALAVVPYVCRRLALDMLVKQD